MNYYEKGTVPDEGTLLRAAAHYPALSPGNIAAIGGTLTLSQISNYKRLRLRSRDVDFIVNDRGLEAIFKQR